MIRGFSFHIQSNSRSLHSANTFKTAKKALEVAKADFKAQGLQGESRITIFNEDGQPVMVYDRYGNGWVKRQQLSLR